MEFKISSSAKQDIQEQIHYYNDKQSGLGKKFYSEVKNTFSSIRKNSYYQVRYDDIRCFPLKKFPAMIHFKIENEDIVVWAVINTYRNPSTNWVK